MEFHCKLIYELPEEAIRLLGLTEDTVFETYFENGAIVVRPISADEVEELDEDDEWECDGDCDDCEFEDCCPYEDDEDEDDCFPGTEECETCEYWCSHCGRCVLDDKEM